MGENEKLRKKIEEKVYGAIEDFFETEEGKKIIEGAVQLYLTKSPGKENLGEIISDFLEKEETIEKTVDAYLDKQNLEPKPEKFAYELVELIGRDSVLKDNLAEIIAGLL